MPYYSKFLSVSFSCPSAVGAAAAPALSWARTGAGEGMRPLGQGLLPEQLFCSGRRDGRVEFVASGVVCLLGASFWNDFGDHGQKKKKKKRVAFCSWK